MYLFLCQNVFKLIFSNFMRFLLKNIANLCVNNDFHQHFYHQMRMIKKKKLR